MNLGQDSVRKGYKDDTWITHMTKGERAQVTYENIICIILTLKITYSKTLRSNIMQKRRKTRIKEYTFQVSTFATPECYLIWIQGVWINTYSLLHNRVISLTIKCHTEIHKIFFFCYFKQKTQMIKHWWVGTIYYMTQLYVSIS